ncbi:MAG: hypothetical protein WCH44_17965 [Betaproteobacteria bacterium]
MTNLHAKIEYVSDALISQRAFKASMPHEQASEIMACEAGRHFDPDISAALAVLVSPFRTC